MTLVTIVISNPLPGIGRVALFLGGEKSKRADTVTTKARIFQQLSVFTALRVTSRITKSY